MLSLSTEAAPALALEAFAAACRARGLDGAELVVGPDADPAAVAAAARAGGVRVVALRALGLDAARAHAIAQAAASLGVPVSVPPGEVSDAELARLVPAFAACGARLLLGYPTDLDAALAAIATLALLDAPRTLGLAWEIDPSATALDDASAVLLATREHLGLVRLRGGGPEQRAQDGRGIGPLIVELALSGYAGPLVLCPSRPTEVTRWTTWLAARGSSGCGHAVDTRTVALDVRDVEPRDRLDTILGAYRMLVPGATLHLTVDHDPSCMYYMLEATEPEHSFAFQIVEHGPETWRAEVTRR